MRAPARKKTLFLATVPCVLITSICFAGSPGNQNKKTLHGNQDEPMFHSAKRVTFFQDCLKLIPSQWHPFVQLPSKTKSFEPSKHKSIVRVFSGDMRRVFKPKLIPDDHFILQHVHLVPASNVKNSEADVVYLPFRFEGKDYLIAESGGWKPNISLVVSRNNSDRSETAKDAKKLSLEIAEKYVALPRKSELPETVANKRRDCYIITSNFNKKLQTPLQTPMNYFSAVVSPNSVGIMFNTNSFYGKQPARVPAPNEWFSWIEDSDNDSE